MAKQKWSIASSAAEPVFAEELWPEEREIVLVAWLQYCLDTEKDSNSSIVGRLESTTGKLYKKRQINERLNIIWWRYEDDVLKREDLLRVGVTYLRHHLEEEGTDIEHAIPALKEQYGSESASV